MQVISFMKTKLPISMQQMPSIVISYTLSTSMNVPCLTVETMMITQVVTMRYRAPEVIMSRGQYTSAVDMYAHLLPVNQCHCMHFTMVACDVVNTTLWLCFCSYVDQLNPFYHPISF